MADPPADPFARALAFEHHLHESAAERSEDLEWGQGLFNDTFDRVYDLNALYVDQGVTDVTTGRLVADAERLHVAAGHEHRRIVVPEARLGERLAPEFAARGWEVRRFIFMAQLREPDDPTPPAAVHEIDEAAHREAKRWFMAGAPEAYDDRVVEQLLDRDRLKEEVVEFRRFGVEAGGKVVSVCELYSNGSTAQVEDVSTMEGYRGRGFARSTVLAAIAAGRAAGCDFVFLVADEDDWPKELYAKLGFDPLGTVFDFLRLPPGERPPPKAPPKVNEGAVAPS